MIASTPTLNPRTRTLLMAVRQALLIVLGAIEDYLSMERSVTPKHRRVYKMQDVEGNG